VLARDSNGSDLAPNLGHQYFGWLLFINSIVE
jgi:hypothetical protein